MGPSVEEILKKQAGIEIGRAADLYLEDNPEVAGSLGDVKDPNIILKPTLKITDGIKLAAVKAGLIPNKYIDCDFDTEKIRANEYNQQSMTKRFFKVRNFDAYCNVTEGIISTIIANKLPDRSYIIGAPNGYGKTSFVYTCILKMFAQDRSCVPYISLTELAQVRLNNEQMLVEGILSDRYYTRTTKTAFVGQDYIDKLYEGMDEQTYAKRPIHIVDKFSWGEYINCDLLFCYFTDVSSRVIESETLKAVVNVRGTKGLPTIAMISTSLDPYKNDQKLSEMVWNEILDPDNTMPGYDRFQHVSCYKDYNAPLERNIKPKTTDNTDNPDDSGEGED